MSPHTNSFFNSTYPGQSSEQTLIDDLVIEQIGIYGLDVLYMPRRHLNLDKLLHESSKAAFELALPMPMYLKSFSGYDNSMELLTKFGVRSSDEITLVMSRSQFTAYYGPYLKSYYNGLNGNPPTDELNPLDGEIATRPKEGDLIYFPFDDGIFEIKYVMFDSPFFQLGRGYVFELQCEKFEYSGESFTTGYDEIDEQQIRPDYYRMEFQTQPEGSTGTFTFNEEVILYDMSADKYLQTEVYKLLQTEKSQSIIFDEENPSDTRLLPNYELVAESPLQTETPKDIQTEEETTILTEVIRKVFRLYKDPGFLEQVPEVHGRVLEWDKPEGKLIVGDLTNLDPDKEDENKDITENKFDVVLIVGQESGARYVSIKAEMMEAPFSDNEIIQKEFDAIKIVDVADDNPFGFV
jgi:hypothetical protein